jgi:transposase-like protein
MSTKTKKCPLCNSSKVVKRGIQNGLQTYWCKECNNRFRSERKKKIHIVEDMWNMYVFRKQTIRELKEIYQVDKKTVVSYLEQHIPKEKVHNPRPVNLVVDATYFGTREDRQCWCIVVFRDPKEKENIWWEYGYTETESIYSKGRTYLESLGYTILSVTGDGFGGLRTAFSGIPYQMCLVHMERIVLRGTTRKPKLIQGQVLLAIMKSIYASDEETFKRRVYQYIEKYRDFLNEKATSELTGDTWFVHEDLRKAVLSLQRFLPYLFTYTKNKSTPATTNSLEGHFRHVKEIVAIHGGMSRRQKERVLDSIMLEGSIVPKRNSV